MFGHGFFGPLLSDLLAFAIGVDLYRSLVSRLARCVGAKVGSGDERSGLRRTAFEDPKWLDIWVRNGFRVGVMMVRGISLGQKLVGFTVIDLF